MQALFRISVSMSCRTSCIHQLQSWKVFAIISSDIPLFFQEFLGCFHFPVRLESFYASVLALIALGAFSLGTLVL